jgi:hypothetical protein
MAMDQQEHQVRMVLEQQAAEERMELWKRRRAEREAAIKPLAQAVDRQWARWARVTEGQRKGDDRAVETALKEIESGEGLGEAAGAALAVRTASVWAAFVRAVSAHDALREAVRAAQGIQTREQRAGLLTVSFWSLVTMPLGPELSTGYPVKKAIEATMPLAQERSRLGIPEKSQELISAFEALDRAIDTYVDELPSAVPPRLPLPPAGAADRLAEQAAPAAAEAGDHRTASTSS